jgi:hypothetical protein
MVSKQVNHLKKGLIVDRPPNSCQNGTIAGQSSGLEVPKKFHFSPSSRVPGQDFERSEKTLLATLPLMSANLFGQGSRTTER